MRIGRKVSPFVLAMALMSVVMLGFSGFAQASATTPDLPAMHKSAVFTIGSTTVTVDGATYQMDVAPYINSNGRAMIPVRYLSDLLMANNATWQATTDAVGLTFGGDNVNMVVGSPYLTVDGKKETMDTVPVVVPPGRTMLPVRYVAQAVGYTVSWNAGDQTVTIALDLSKLNPEQVVNLWVESFEKGNAKTINSLMSNNFLQQVNNGKGYASFPAQKMSNIQITFLPHLPLTPLPPDAISSNTKVYYNVGFTLDDASNPMFFPGKGNYGYFVTVVFENDSWKVDSYSTGP